jgi:hypothetical protein
MKIKRLASLATALLLSMCFSVPTTVAHAATIKPGAACSKVGATKTVAAKKYTCIEVGSKRVWNKGSAAVAKPKPSASTSPEPLVPISLDNLDPNQVRKQAYANVFAAIKESKSFSPNITFVVGPSLTADRVDKEKSALTMTSSFWSDIYKPNQIFIGYVTEQDVDWVDDAYCAQAKYCPAGSNNVVVSNVIKQDAPYCSSAQATRNSDGLPFFNQCLGKGSDGLKNRQTGPHEYTHFVQQDVSSMDPSVPNWWTEGSADYFGGAIGAFDGTQLPKTLDEMVHTSSYNWVQQNLCDLSTVSEAAVVACYKYTYRQSGPPGAGSKWMLAHVSYYQGALATEALVALHGMAKIKTFITDIKAKGFENAFVANFGVSSDVFYEKVAKYVVAMYEAGR